MKNKSTIILGVIFLVLVGIYFMVSYRPREISEGARPLFEEALPEIDKVEFTSASKGRIVLEKQNGEWFVTEPLEYKAFDRDVEMMLDQLADIKIEGIISTRKEARNEYSVGDSTGTLFTAYSGGQPVIEAIVGKHAMHVGHTYARMKGSDEIMMWRGMFSQEVIRGADDWRDKRVYSYNAQDITSVKIEQDGLVRELALEDTIWVYTENGEEKPVDTQNVLRSLGVMANLICDDFGDENDIPRAAAREPDIRVTFKVRNGDVNVYDVWSPQEDENTTRYLMRKENGEFLYRFYQSRGRFITLDYEIMKP